MPHLPVFRANCFAAIVGALHLRRMLGVHRREHLLLAQEPVVEIFNLRREAEIRIGIEGVRVSARAAASSTPAATESASSAPAKSRQVPNTVREHIGRFTTQFARLRI